MTQDPIIVAPQPLDSPWLRTCRFRWWFFWWLFVREPIPLEISPQMAALAALGLAAFHIDDAPWLVAQRLSDLPKQESADA